MNITIQKCSLPYKIITKLWSSMFYFPVFLLVRFWILSRNAFFNCQAKDIHACRKVLGGRRLSGGHQKGIGRSLEVEGHQTDGHLIPAVFTLKNSFHSLLFCSSSRSKNSTLLCVRDGMLAMNCHHYWLLCRRCISGLLQRSTITKVIYPKYIL